MAKVTITFEDSEEHPGEVKVSMHLAGEIDPDTVEVEGGG